MKIDESLMALHTHTHTHTPIFKQIGFIYYASRTEKNIINKCKKEMVGFESKKC